MTSDYFQVPVADKDRPKMAFMSPVGNFEYTRIPLGLKGTPTTFQQLVGVLLANTQNYPRAYLDDIVVFSGSWKDHMTYLTTLVYPGGSQADSRWGENANRHGQKQVPRPCINGGKVSVSLDQPRSKWSSYSFSRKLRPTYSVSLASPATTDGCQ